MYNIAAYAPLLLTSGLVNEDAFLYKSVQNGVETVLNK
jgi:hypothetical protein